MKRFENKVCLVMGASSGIGRATAISFAKEEANVVVSDLNEAAEESVVNKIKAVGRFTFFVKCDIS